MLIPDIHVSRDPPTSSVSEFVRYWNIQFPLDKWYRTRHSIQWGVKRHREVSLLSIRFEYEESKLFINLQEEKELVPYEPGDWFSGEGQDIESSQEVFDQIDLDSINESGDIILK